MNRLLPILLLTAPLTNLAAQEVPAIERGDRVRVQRDSSDSWKAGTVVSFDADTLVLKESLYHKPLVIPLTSTTQIEVRSGGVAFELRQGFAGAAIGFGVGSMVAFYRVVDHGVEALDNFPWNLEREQEPVFKSSVFIGTLLGFVLGGADIQSYEWEAVPLNPTTTAHNENTTRERGPLPLGGVYRYRATEQTRIYVDIGRRGLDEGRKFASTTGVGLQYTWQNGWFVFGETRRMSWSQGTLGESSERIGSNELTFVVGKRLSVH